MTINIIVRAAGLALPAALSLLLQGCNSAPESEPTGAASEAPAAAVSITGPWTRETAQGQSAGGGFMTIANPGSAPDRLVSGTSPAAGEVQIHTVSMDGGVMRMRQLEDGLEIPAGGTVELKPGSFHIMLIDLAQPLKAGSKVPLVLHFEKAGDIEVELDIRPVTATGPAASMDHGGMAGHAG